jgi:hypothetical protein
MRSIRPEQPKANDVGERRDLIRRARVFDARRDTIGDAKALLHFTQNQDPAVRRHPAAIEFGDDCLAWNGDRPGSGSIGSFMAGVAFSEMA